MLLLFIFIKGVFNKLYFLNDFCNVFVYFLAHKASDVDDLTNNEIVFNIAEEDDSKPFTIDSSSGNIYTTHLLNATVTPRYELTVNADNVRDGEVVQRTQTTVIVSCSQIMHIPDIPYILVSRKLVIITCTFTTGRLLRY